MIKVEGDEIVSGGANRLRLRRPRTSKWKPLMGADTFVNGRPAGAAGLERPAVGAGAPMAAAAANAAVQYNPKVQAGMFLLRAAKRNPKARRKVQRIAERAADGDPRAKQTMRTLRIAKAVEDQKRAAAKKKRGRQLPAMTTVSVEPATALPSGKASLFRNWEKGSG